MTRAVPGLLNLLLSFSRVKKPYSALRRLASIRGRFEWSTQSIMVPAQPVVEPFERHVRSVGVLIDTEWVMRPLGSASHSPPLKYSSFRVTGNDVYLWRRWAEARTTASWVYDHTRKWKASGPNTGTCSATTRRGQAKVKCKGHARPAIFKMVNCKD